MTEGLLSAACGGDNEDRKDQGVQYRILAGAGRAQEKPRHERFAIRRLRDKARRLARLGNVDTR